MKNTPAGEVTSPEFPILLTTGRIVVQYNSGSMTLRCASLQERDPELYVEMNPKDASELKINAGDMAVVITRRGQAEARVRITEKVKPEWSSCHSTTTERTS